MLTYFLLLLLLLLFLHDPQNCNFAVLHAIFFKFGLWVSCSIYIKNLQQCWHISSSSSSSTSLKTVTLPFSMQFPSIAYRLRIYINVDIFPPPPPPPLRLPLPPPPPPLPPSSSLLLLLSDDQLVFVVSLPLLSVSRRTSWRSSNACKRRRKGRLRRTMTAALEGQEEQSEVQGRKITTWDLWRAEEEEEEEKKI